MVPRTKLDGPIWENDGCKFGLGAKIEESTDELGIFAPDGILFIVGGGPVGTVEI